MTPSRPRVILDCNILVQAVLSPDGPGRACVELADAGVIALVTSRESLAEARDVLNRPEIRRLKPELSPADVRASWKHSHTGRFFCATCLTS